MSKSSPLVYADDTQIKGNLVVHGNLIVTGNIVVHGYVLSLSEIKALKGMSSFVSEEELNNN